MMTVKINVENTSDRDGATSVLVYAIPPNAGNDGIPLKQLITFDKANVPAHQSVSVELPITGYAFTYV